MKPLLVLATGLLLVLLSYPTPLAAQTIDEDDKLALQDLYSGFDDTSSLNWNFAQTDCADYSHVSCDSNGKIVQVNLRNVNLDGVLSPSLALLTSLSSVDFSDSGIAGTLPPSLGQITPLVYLAFSGCGLRGTLPSELSELPNLLQLALNDNQLTGTIHEGFFTQPYLDYLSLHRNDFIGSLPSTLVARHDFEELFMEDNEFSCPVEDYSTWTNFPSGNDFESDCIAPADINAEDRAALISLYNGFTNAATQLSSWDVGAATWRCDKYPGVICDGTGKVTKLYLGNLDLMGTISPGVGNLTMLIDLALDYNLLTGEVPTSLGNLADLEWLWLGSNFFSFPDYATWGDTFTDSPSRCRPFASLVFDADTSLYQCQCDDGYFLTDGECVPVYCEEESYDHGYFSTILASVNGAPSPGVCDSGYYAANPARNCYQQGGMGVWAVNVTDPCVGVYCPAGSDANSTWPETLSQNQLYYECKPGYYSPDTSASCIQTDDTAFLSPISEKCLAVYCEEDTSNPVVTWPKVIAATESVGTCATGYYSANPKRYCAQDGPTTTFTTITNPCLPVYCNAYQNFSANFGQIQAPAIATGVCWPGFYSAGGGPTLTCSQGPAGVGVWGSSVTDPCVQVYCPAGADDVSTWSSKESATYGNFVCKPGYYSPDTSMFCVPQGSSASWGRVYNPCQAITCAADDTDPATYWPAVQSSKTTNGTCKAGYYTAGIPKRNCVQDGDEGIWTTPTLSCSPVYCAAGSYNHASWNQTLSATTATGDCDSGYYSSNPTRQCLQTGGTGTWSSVVTNPCQPVYCSAGSSTNYTWPEMQAGSTTELTCKPGFYSEDPLATCVQDGDTAEWTLPAELCLPVYCPANVTDGISFPETQGARNATGVCGSGYAGNVVRLCRQEGNTTFWEPHFGVCLLVPTLPPIPPESSPVVVAIFRLVNINYDWYRNGINQETFDLAFIEFVSSLFGVNPGAVDITKVSRGSIFIEFQILTTAPEELKGAITRAIQNTELNLSILLVALPPEAFEDGTLTAHIDPTQSTVVETKEEDNNAGPIAGGVIGGLAAVGLIGGAAYYMYRKRKQQAILVPDQSAPEGLATDSQITAASLPRKLDKGKRRMVAGLDTEMEELERS